MKKLLFVLAALISVSQAQTIQYIGAPTTTVISKGNFRSDSLFYLPKRTKLPTDSGAVRYQISDSSVYYWTGSQWRRLGVHIDTASMLNPYLRGSGTANYLPIFDATRSVINSKVYQSGNHLMFNTTTPSVSAAEYGTMDVNGSENAAYVLKVGDAEKSYILSNGTDLTISNNPAGDLIFRNNNATRGRFTSAGQFRVNNLASASTRLVTADTDGNLAGTVSITQFIDTTEISTRAWVQRGDDSLGALIATKVNISDTSSMLSPYLRKVDTTAMLSPYARTSNVNASLAFKLNISDTATMLSPYLKESDTTFLSNRINLKVNISDTASMLTNYIRHAGNGLTKSGQALSVDTAAIATRARVQKGIDSVATLATAGVTSVATGYGLSGGTITTTGTIIADTLQLSTRAWRQKGLDSLAALEISGSGTTNYVPKFTAARTIGDSRIFDNGTNVGIGNASPGQRLHIGNNTETSIGLRISPSLVNWDLASDAGGDLTISNGLGNYFELSRTAFYVNVGASSGGTTTPTAIELDDTYTTTDGFDKLKMYLYRDGSQSYGLGLGSIADVQYWAGSSSTGVHRFFTSQTERMRLNASGELLLNTTTDAGDYKLQVSGNAYVTGTTVLAATSGNVGVGTASPSAKLSIVTADGTASQIQLLQTGRRDYYIGLPASASYLDFYDASAGASRMALTSAGNLGIGTTQAAQKLHIQTPDGTASLIRIGQSNQRDWFIGLQASQTYLDFYDASVAASRMRINDNGELLINTGTDAGDYKLQVSGNAYVTGTTVLAATSGNVGVGTASPTGVTNKILNLYNVSSSEIHFTNNTTGTGGTDGWQLAHSGNDAYVFNFEPGFILFGTNNTEAARINSAREFIISPSGVDSGDYQLQVVGNTYFTGTNILAATSGAVVKIGTTATEPSAKLDVFSTTRGFLPPRMTTTQRDAISSPAAGLVIYNTTTSKLQVYTTAWTDLH
jgi:hypothetical protein